MSSYYIARNGNQLGPYLVSEIHHRIQTGEFAKTDLCWQEGMTGWQPISIILGLGEPAREILPPPIPQFPPSIVPTAPQPPLAGGPISTPSPCRAVSAPDPIFINLPIWRFAVMSVLSFGLYEAWWAYKYWQYVKKRDSLNISPFWRGWFILFYIHKLLNAVHDDKEANAVEQATFRAGGLATGYVILLLLTILISKASAGSMVPLLIAGLIPTWVPLIPAQTYLNRVNQKRHPETPTHRWSLGQVACLVWGLFWWMVVLAAVGGESMA